MKLRRWTGMPWRIRPRRLCVRSHGTWRFRERRDSSFAASFRVWVGCAEEVLVVNKISWFLRAVLQYICYVNLVVHCCMLYSWSLLSHCKKWLRLFTLVRLTAWLYFFVYTSTENRRLMFPTFHCTSWCQCQYEQSQRSSNIYSLLYVFLYCSSNMFILFCRCFATSL